MQTLCKLTGRRRVRAEAVNEVAELCLRDPTPDLEYSGR
jgi:hypothetical protein